MGFGRGIGRGGRPAPLVAALAMLALVVQLLLPAAAMAKAGPDMVICTGKGAVTVAADAGQPPARGFAGLACQDCVTTAVAALPAPGPAPIPVRYAVQAPPSAQTGSAAQPRARAPPRPPSTAPPIQTPA